MQTSKLRLGVPRNLFYESLDQEIAIALAAAIEVLRKLTASVRETTLPSGSVPFDELYTTLAVSKLTPTTRNGSPSLRKSIRQSLAS